MSAPDLKPRTALLALLAILAVAGAVRLAAPDAAYFNIHAARDCFRTLQFLWGENFRTHGPELRFGGQTPGWLLYPLRAPPLAISTNPIGVTLWIGLLATVGVWVTFLIGRDFGGSRRLGLVAALLTAVQIPIVLSLRYLWNPCFLPVLTPLLMYFLLQVCVARRSGFFPWLVLVYSAAACVHFSTHLLLLPILVTFALARPHLRRRDWLLALAVLGVTFGPYVLREIRDGFENSRQIFTSDQALIGVDDVRPAGERWRFNYHMPIVLAHHLSIPVPEGPFALRESGISQDFSHFVHFYHRLDETAWAPKIIRATAWASQVWIVVFVLGFFALAIHLRRTRHSPPPASGEGPGVGARPRAEFVWLLWFGLPALVLLFFNFYKPPTEAEMARPAVVSFRYFYILAPAQFLIMAWAVGRAYAWDGRGWRRVLTGFLAVYTLGCVHLMAEFLHTARRTGVVFVHCGILGRDIYTLGLKERLAKHLVDDLGLTPAGIERRLSGNWIFLRQWWLEDDLEYLLRSDPRLRENPPDDALPLIRLWADHPEQNTGEPAIPLPEGASTSGLASDEVEILGDETFGRIHVTQYRLRDPNQPPPEFNMNNRWERMEFP